jgi:dTMP kinase
MDLFTRIKYPGRLIVVEGIDGSGKSTQIQLLQKFLASQGYPVVFTEWNSSELVKKTTKRAKRKQTLTPTTFSLLHATDFAHRFHHQVLPPLKAGMLVLADRYVFTAYARVAVRPDVAFYFRVPIEVGMQRILSGRPKLKYYEAGMDLNLAPDVRESFRIFQTRILEKYDAMTEEVGFTVIDATQPVNEQQRLVRERTLLALQGYSGRRHIVFVPRLYPEVEQ